MALLVSVAVSTPRLPMLAPILSERTLKISERMTQTIREPLLITSVTMSETLLVWEPIFSDHLLNQLALLSSFWGHPLQEGADSILVQNLSVRDAIPL